MPRPRSTTDDHLLDAVQAVLDDDGPAALTLTRVARRAGVSAATLVKRFGSRQQMLSALSTRWIDSVKPGMAAAARARTTPLARLRAAVLWGREDLDTAEHTANMLAALALDLSVPELTQLLGAGWRAIEDELVPLVEAAVDSGALTDEVPAARMARILRALCEGACLAWMTAPDGSLAERLAEDVDTVLAAWRTPAASHR